MDSLSVEYLLAAAQYMNFTKAAEALYVSQSSVSKRIARLEAELGVTIFDRSSKRVKLTEDGKILVDCLTLCRDSFTLAISQIQAKYRAINTLSLGIINGWDLSHVIAPVLDTFALRYPEVRVKIVSDSMFALIDRFQQGTLDVIFSISDAFPAKADYVISSCGLVQNVLLFSSKNPLAQKENLSLTDFCELPLYHQGPFQSLSRKGSKHPPFHKEMEHEEFPSWDALLMAVTTGRGYSICNKLFRDLNSPLFCNLELPYYDEIILVQNRTRLLPEIDCLVKSICRHGL